MLSHPFEIRPFRVRDRRAVIALWDEVFADDPPRNDPPAVIQRKLRVQRELFLVGEVGGAVVGTVIGGYDGYRGWIYHLAVDPANRRQGYGSDLVRAAEARMRARGCIKVNLQVRARNAGVVRFYEALGYGTEDLVSMGRLLG